MSDASFDLALALKCVDPSWTPLFDIQQKNLQNLFVALKSRCMAENISPSVPHIFRAFEIPLSDIRVLILGQDPYPTPDVAIGRAFAVEKSVALPASLRNIEKEVQRTFDSDARLDQTLQTWVDQGVFLLNTALTVDTSQPQIGHFDLWRSFTEAALNFVTQNSTDVVWLLWGNEAAKYATYTNEESVIRTSHPSPLSAYRGFNGSGMFLECNRKLVQNGHSAIDWLKT